MSSPWQQMMELAGYPQGVAYKVQEYVDYVADFDMVPIIDEIEGLIEDRYETWITGYNDDDSYDDIAAYRVDNPIVSEDEWSAIIEQHERTPVHLTTAQEDRLLVEYMNHQPDFDALNATYANVAADARVLDFIGQHETVTTAQADALLERVNALQNGDDKK